MVSYGYRVSFIFLVFTSLTCNARADGEISCQKINFNSQDRRHIEKCPKVSQEMTKKEYVNSKVFKPFWKDAEFYLSNKNLGVSCEQTSQTFVLEKTSIVQMTNFLYFEQKATLTVRVLDLDDIDQKGNVKAVYEWNVESDKKEWKIFSKMIDREISRAKIQIECNVDSLSTFAIEHLHVINPANTEDEECQEENWYPDISTTSTSSTTESSTTTESTTTVTPETSSTTEYISSTTTSSSTTNPTESTTNDGTETTDDETTISTSESTSSETSTSSSSEISTSSSTSVDPETSTFSTSSTENPSPSDPEYNLLYFYLIISAGAIILIIGIIVFIVIVCKVTGKYEPKTPTTTVRPKPLNNADTTSVNSDFSISFETDNSGLTNKSTAQASSDRLNY